ncbi:DUF2480 family protein [Aquimarina hainanensis]|uniref:DUF2480 family protein n=1 Tax=Aquimarina hainanensis TaxID=1578017 RepID=A0ABW5N149_9FLAO|nr:DUF2480 family protein [Aquimarina sp. TRL1]QKX04659.1 DUF2480 family protein [Aquimarina sp. TRL1]
MADEIINRVANNKKLITFDLEEYYPTGKRQQFDIKDWLYEGLILKENDFRDQVASHDWSAYQDTYVALHCSSEAIIPGWAYLLVTSALAPYAKKVVVGTLQSIETILYTEIIQHIDPTPYKDKMIIIKGCSNKPVPEEAYIAILQKLQPVAKSIMYGEACSAVPLFKKK